MYILIFLEPECAPESPGGLVKQLSGLNPEFDRYVVKPPSPGNPRRFPGDVTIAGPGSTLRYTDLEISTAFSYINHKILENTVITSVEINIYLSLYIIILSQV